MHRLKNSILQFKRCSLADGEQLVLKNFTGKLSKKISEGCCIQRGGQIKQVLQIQFSSLPALSLRNAHKTILKASFTARKTPFLCKIIHAPKDVWIILCGRQLHSVFQISFSAVCPALAFLLVWYKIEVIKSPYAEGDTVFYSKHSIHSILYGF